MSMRDFHIRTKATAKKFWALLAVQYKLET